MLGFLLVYNVDSYEGLCPKNAICYATMQCFEGYEFDREIVRKRIAIIGLKGLPALGGAATVGESIINELKFLIS